MPHLTEQEVRSRHITPAITSAGWDLHTQVREEYTLTPGRVLVRGVLAKRARPGRADYVLFAKPHLPIAVVEAKDSENPMGGGIEQALAYADKLDAPFAFSSNGEGFVFHDRTGISDPVEQNLDLGSFPSPDQLWDLYRVWKGWDRETEELATAPWYDAGDKQPRYYQEVAAQRIVEAIARGQQRLLLVMATGTGKTYTAFQILWRLRRAEKAKRVLFLADRNILVDQTITNDFMPFGEAMTKVQNREVDKAFEIYLALYQAVSGEENWKNIYREFSPDFFDVIVVDECHRGSARADSQWREVLEYFEPAIQLGMTATPKETEYVSNIDYFGEPVYTYSLKQGIQDGFLAPYKVVRVDLDKDLLGWRPPRGMVDDLGQEIADRIYDQRDMDTILVLNERTKRVAGKVMDYMEATAPYGKTIVFCEDIEHAARMRQTLVNEVARRLPDEADNRHFVVRMTSGNPEGTALLDDFIHPEERYPVIVTTSKLLSTGVDTQTARLIVLDQRIQSMTDFKQIVGRGTRIHEEAGKYWFTIMDFKKATELFADPAFDGVPEQIHEPGSEDPIVPPDPGPLPDPEDLPPDGEEGSPRSKYRVGGVEVSIIAERVQYYGKDGRLVTESLKDYTRSAVQERFETLDDFLRRWSEAERKQAVIQELEEEGVLFEELLDQVGRELDPFDLICHVAYDRPALTRRERAARVRKQDGVFAEYGEAARAVLDALLDKYADEGLRPIESRNVLRVPPLSDLGTPVELVNRFGGKEEYEEAVRALEHQLYRDAC